MKNIKYTFGSLLLSFLYFVFMDSYYYLIGFYTGFYTTWFQAIIGGQQFAITHSYLKMLLIPIIFDLLIFIRKRTAVKFYENKVISN